MKDKVYKTRDHIIRFIDFFYPPFSKIIDQQTFRYAVCGGSNTVFDILLFAFTYNYILKKEIFHIAGLSISPHIAAFMLTFPISFLSGFFLMRYVVFPASAAIKKRVQITKYFTVVFICILLNYGFLKLFVDYLHWWPLPSKLVTTLFVVLFSYFSQKNFAFKHKVT